GFPLLIRPQTPTATEAGENYSLSGEAYVLRLDSRTLVIEVMPDSDKPLQAGFPNWLANDHVEIWALKKGLKGKNDMLQWGIGIIDGIVIPAFGESKAMMPVVEVVKVPNSAWP